MKIFVSVLAFAMTLALTSQSVASGGGEGHGDLAEKMNALFPPHQPDMNKRAVPATPQISAPAYFSKVEGDKASLQWTAVEGADEYHVQIATDPAFKWLVVNEYHNKTNSYDVSGLEAGKQYFWRVAAVKSNNWSTFRKSFFATSMFATASK